MLNNQAMRPRMTPMRAAAGLAWLSALVLGGWAGQLGLQHAAATTAQAASHAQQTELPTASTVTAQPLNFTHHLPTANTLPSRAHTLIETSQRDAAARGGEVGVRKSGSGF